MTVITPPTVEPVSLIEAKAHLRVTDASQDVEIARQISTAREYAEQFCSQAFAATTYEARGLWFDLPLLGPVVSLSSVKYLDPDGAEQTLANTVYELYLDALRLKIGQEWPSIYSRDDAVRVQFVAGRSPAAVPFLVKAAMLLIVGTLNENRESQNDKQTFSMPLRVQDLLFPYRTGLGV